MPWQTSRVLDFLKRRRGKLGAVVITGGEPTYQPNLIKFVKHLKRMGYLIKLDTNGSRPDVIKALAEKDLVDYWAMDVKAPPALYQVITKSDVPFGNILASMDLLRDSGREYEFRTTFFENLFHWEDIEAIRELLCPGDKFYLQECRYDNTLEDVRRTAPANGEDAIYPHLRDDPACQSLIRWGGEHQVAIHIRSL